MKTIEEQYMAEEVYGTPIAANIFWPDIITTPASLLSSVPDLIVLGLWPNACDDQIESYTQAYKALYPSARQVILRYSSQRSEVEAATNAILEAEEKPLSEFKGKVLLHIFGNDAAERTCQLLRSYHLRTGVALPVQLLIMDEVPQVLFPTLKSPQQLLMYMYIILWTWLVATLTLTCSNHVSDQVHQTLHDPHLVPAEARRCYHWQARKRMLYCDNYEDDEVLGDEHTFEV